MEKVFYIKDSIENKISYYHLLFFLLTLPFDRFYSSVIFISFLFHTLVFLRKEKLKNITARTFILQSVFMATIVAALYGISFTDALNTVSKQLTILLFPLLFAVTSLDLVKYRFNLLLGFSLGCTITVAYLFFDAVHVILYNKLSLKSLFSPAFVNHNFSLPIEMHATYLSMLLGIAVIFLLLQLFSRKDKNQKIVFVACLLLLLAGLLQLGSKSVFIALAIIINAGFPWLVLKSKARRRFLFISIPLFAVLIFFILSVDIYRNRYMTTLKNDFYANTMIPEKNARIERWNTAIALIKKSPLTGTGSGSEIPLLREMYFERKMYVEYLHSLNVHNQYLSFLINNGIMGLLVYLATLVWGFRQSIKKKDVLLLSFMILTTVVSFSENILDVNKGIFFYAFFFSFFIMSQSSIVSNRIFLPATPRRKKIDHSMARAVAIFKSHNQNFDN